MDFEIVWAEPALDAFEEAIGYIRDRNPQAAEKVGAAILQRVEILRTSPLIGSLYPRGSVGNRREIFSGNYRICYRVCEDKKLIEILTVWHTSRGEPLLPE